MQLRPEEYGAHTFTSHIHSHTHSLTLALCTENTGSKMADCTDVTVGCALTSLINKWQYLTLGRRYVRSLCIRGWLVIQVIATKQASTFLSLSLSLSPYLSGSFFFFSSGDRTPIICRPAGPVLQLNARSQMGRQRFFCFATTNLVATNVFRLLFTHSLSFCCWWRSNVR